MKKILEFIVKIIFVLTISVLISIFQIGINSFVDNLFISLIYLFCSYIFAFFITNWCNTILYIVLGKLFNLKIATLNMYPLFILFNKAKVSISILQFVKINNAYNLNNITLENIKNFIDLKEKIKKKVELFELCVAYIFLFLGFFINNSFFVIISSTFYVKIIIRKSFTEIDISSNDESMLFYELVFSKQANSELYEHHLRYLLKNIVTYIDKPEKINYINLILFAYFNNNQLNKECLNELDKAIIQLVKMYGNEIDVACRDILFNYVDNRIVLGTLDNEKEYLNDFLDLYITFDWDVELPNVYLERTKELKMYMKGNDNRIKFRQGNEIYLCKQNYN